MTERAPLDVDAVLDKWGQLWAVAGYQIGYHEVHALVAEVRRLREMYEGTAQWGVEQERRADAGVLEHRRLQQDLAAAQARAAAVEAAVRDARNRLALLPWPSAQKTVDVLDAVLTAPPAEGDRDGA